MSWHALAAAQAAVEPLARVPFWIDGCAVGSIARDDLAALRGWPRGLDVDARGVTLTAAAADRDATLATLNAALREQGLVRGWRDERLALVDPGRGIRLARIERAAARFWGALTLAAHANGYVADANGRPAQLWIARRAASKATDPGLLDNLVGGGVADGSTPWQALVREGWEEAGLGPPQMGAARPGHVIRLRRRVPEGLQVEDLHGFDLALPAHVRPVNQDGEVESFRCVPVALALSLAAGREMTVEAGLVTLDFALRHCLLPAAEAGPLRNRLAPLITGSAQGDRLP